MNYYHGNKIILLHLFQWKYFIKMKMYHIIYFFEALRESNKNKFNLGN